MAGMRAPAPRRNARRCRPDRLGHRCAPQGDPGEGVCSWWPSVAGTAIAARLDVCLTSAAGSPRTVLPSSGRSARAAAASRDPGGDDRGDRARHAARDTSRPKALGRAVHGRRAACQQGHCATGMEGPKPTAAPGSVGLVDVVGVYCNPPESAVVLHMDEKSASKPARSTCAARMARSARSTAAIARSSSIGSRSRTRPGGTESSSC